MLKRIRKNIKGQNTAEYAILISLVVAGIIAMQTYAQRGLQGRVKAASKLLTDVGSTTRTGGIFTTPTEQYEPYYLRSDYTSNREDTEIQELGINRVVTRADSTSNRIGFQVSEYNKEFFGVGDEAFK